MKYTKEKAALQAYIDNFDPDEFSSSAQYRAFSPPGPEQIAHVQKLKSKLKRRRQMVESLQSLLVKEKSRSEMFITQAEVDALLDEWSAKNH